MKYILLLFSLFFSFNLDAQDIERICYQKPSSDTVYVGWRQVIKKVETIRDTTMSIVQGAYEVPCKVGVSEIEICINGDKGLRRICKDQNGNISKEFEDQNGKEIEEPKEYFIGSCDDIECTEESQTLCVDGNYEGVSDGDALLLSVKTCEGSDPVITGATLVTNPTVPITLPSDIVFKICDTPVETELIGCVVDEDGVRWNEILINGLTTAYQNQSTNEFGTPNGNTEPCVDPLNITSTWPGRYCIKVGVDTLQAVIEVASNKTRCATLLDGVTTYEQGDYTIVSCCPDGEDTETVYWSGFTVARPGDTPNQFWNNQIVQNPPALQGDFYACFTPIAETGNTPNMIGVTSDPNANASFNTIDCALYLYNNGSTYLLRDYRNGAFNGTLSTGSWVGTEICMERVGGNLFYYANGILLNAASPCTIGTGDVFLDDSHYWRSTGTWSTGSITYSDFVLKEFAGDDIKTVEDCNQSDITIENADFNDTDDTDDDVRVVETVVCADNDVAISVTTYDEQGTFISTNYKKVGATTTFTPSNFDCEDGVYLEKGCVTLSGESTLYCADLSNSSFQDTKVAFGSDNNAFDGIAAPWTVASMADFLNTNDPNNGTWTANDNELCISTNEISLYQSLELTSIGESFPFASNGGQKVSVEITKKIDSDGKIESIRVFSIDGKNEYTNVDTLATLSFNCDDVPDPVCDVVSNDQILCVEVANADFDIDDPILVVQTFECDVFQGTTFYDASDPTTELTTIPELKTCLDEYSVNCSGLICDLNGDEWTTCTVTDSEIPPNMLSVYFTNQNGKIGTPSCKGECPPCDDYIDVDKEKVCAYIDGVRYTGNEFTYFYENNVQANFFQPYNSDKLFEERSYIAYCCDDCIETYGCVGGRGTQVFEVWSNGEILDLNYPVFYTQLASELNSELGITTNSETVNAFGCSNVDLVELQIIGDNSIDSIFAGANVGTAIMLQPNLYGNCKVQNRYVTSRTALCISGEPYFFVDYSEGSPEIERDTSVKVCRTDFECKEYQLCFEADGTIYAGFYTKEIYDGVVTRKFVTTINGTEYEEGDFKLLPNCCPFYDQEERAKLLCTECDNGSYNVVAHNNTSGGALLQISGLNIFPAGSWNLSYNGIDISTSTDLHIDWGDGSSDIYYDYVPNSGPVLNTGIHHTYPVTGHYDFEISFVSDSGLKWLSQGHAYVYGDNFETGTVGVLTPPSILGSSVCEMTFVQTNTGSATGGSGAGPQIFTTQNIKFNNNNVSSVSAVSIDGLATEGISLITTQTESTGYSDGYVATYLSTSEILLQCN